MLSSLAVVLEEPERLALMQLPLDPPGAGDVVVKTLWSGISTGTERLLYSGKMPTFPGMGYPLVPGYETVGEVVEAGSDAGFNIGERVFVPGARCFGAVRGLFGGASSRLTTPAARVLRVDPALNENAVLLALAATAFHARGSIQPGDNELIIGHGVLGRLLARLAVASGAAPIVWEKNPARREGAEGYQVVSPDDDGRRNYRIIIDVSGDAALLDTLIQRLAPGGEVVLAGFYDVIAFAFPPAFMREARLRIAAQWGPGDLEAVYRLVADGRLSLDGLVTHRRSADEAGAAYPIAFGDPACLKMVLDWRAHS